MKILIIVAHPNLKTSFSGRIVDRYKSLVESKPTHSLDIIDLYKKENQQEYFTFDSDKNPKFIEQKSKFQSLISKSDQLIFIHPLWWGGAPAVLKNFLDSNLTSGFAFKHIKRRELLQRLLPIPVRLLKGKSAKVFVTGDGQSLLYALMGMPFMTVWLSFIFIYTGIKPVSLRYFGGMRWRSQENKKKKLLSIKI
jgi:NAD(P)H dehydrogenase (quinone)